MEYLGIGISVIPPVEIPFALVKFLLKHPLKIPSLFKLLVLNNQGDSRPSYSSHRLNSADFV